MIEWQPIETAPKDGTEVLVYDRNGKMHVATWHKSYEQYIGPEWPSRKTAWAPTEEGYEPLDPTHWMPLPEPPK